MSKILHGRYSRLGAFFQKEMFIPGKIANRPKFLDLVNYQQSQNLQNLSTRVWTKAELTEYLASETLEKGRQSGKCVVVALSLIHI